MKDEIRILTPNGILGYGIPEADFWRGIDRNPDAMIVDGGSTDPGPYLLGLPKTIVSRDAYKRDLSLMLDACANRKIPVYISSAGGAGIREQVDLLVSLIQEIAVDKGYHFKIAKIYSDIAPGVVRQAWADGKISPCASAPVLQEDDIDMASNIVAQMGAEPFVNVLREHPDVDVIVAGRSYDPAPFAALCMMHGIEPGIYWHMGKIVECGANCAEPKGKVILATVRRDSFDLEPMSPKERCTPASVAAHTLYEKARPDLLVGPGGTIDLREASYEQINDRAVRVRGSRFIESADYTVKLEGAGIVGMRTIFIGGIRDPILIGQIDDYLSRIKADACKTYPEIRSGAAQIIFHVYGMNGVMGEFEPMADALPHEIGLLGEVTAPTQELANTICSSVRIDVLHTAYDGQLATAGNFAIPLNPPENPIGPVCKYTVYHLMKIDSTDTLFPFEIVEI
ncbi:3-methylaspartate ammonia-lyase [Bordetella tumbae]|uniref:acyclic terpene utilization AtuA family protein n=1 Tax=Bordetella tumbae TaxID=1649139 RepID=UPI0039F09083